MSGLLDHYAGFRFERILAEDDGLHAYLFSNGPRRLVSLFAPQGTTRARLRSDAVAASVFDAMGNAGARRAPRQVTVSVGDYPTTVVLDGATRVIREPAAPAR